MMRLSDAMVEHLRGLADWPDLTGTRYEIRHIIGRGRFSTVYLGLDRALDREVAIKVLSTEDQTRAEQLAREARILAFLEHPGLVPIHDYGVLSDGRPYYVMKYVRGVRLDEYASTATELRERLRIFLRICEAVAFAHAAGVVHGGLEPENVMIGTFGQVLVLDWGAESTDQRDARTDIFALGAILRSICSGQHRNLDAIATTAMAPDPGDRYQSVQLLAADIARHLARPLTFGIFSGTMRWWRRTFRSSKSSRS